MEHVFRASPLSTVFAAMVRPLASAEQPLMEVPWRYWMGMVAAHSSEGEGTALIVLNLNPLSSVEPCVDGMSARPQSNQCCSYSGQKQGPLDVVRLPHGKPQFNK